MCCHLLMPMRGSPMLPIPISIFSISSLKCPSRAAENYVVGIACTFGLKELHMPTSLSVRLSAIRLIARHAIPGPVSKYFIRKSSKVQYPQTGICCNDFGNRRKRIILTCQSAKESSQQAFIQAKSSFEVANDGEWSKVFEGLEENKETFSVRKFVPVVVRPAAKTFEGLYYLSNLDQYQDITVQLVHCFDPKGKRREEKVGEVIRDALAKALVYYFPLAGRLLQDSEGKAVINCTGEGAVFVEATADIALHVLGDVSSVDHEKMIHLVHTCPRDTSTQEMPLLTVQVTTFKCGGFCVGVAVNHRVVDGLAYIDFLRSWAEIARGCPLTTAPFMDRTILKPRQPLKIEFPHADFQDLDDNISNTSILQQNHPLLHKSFLFYPEKFARLRELAMEDGVPNNSTNFSLLAAFVWRAYCKATKMEPHQEVKLLIAVDGRKRFNPPLPKGYFGNAIVLVPCLCNVGELLEKPFAFAVELVEETTKLVREMYLRSVIDYVEVKGGNVNSLGATSFIISSWAGLRFHVMDFGWGEAVQSAPAELYPGLSLFLCPGKRRDCTVVALKLPASAMDTFQEIMKM